MHCYSIQTVSNCTLSDEYLTFQNTFNFNVEEMLRYAPCPCLIPFVHQSSLAKDVHLDTG